MTIYEIAKLAKTSPATVSRVLNNKIGVKQEIRERVQKVIDEMNYKPSLIARELSSKKTNVIGIMMPGINNYFNLRIDAIQNYFNEFGYNIMITSNRRKEMSYEEELKNLELLVQKNVEGIILFVSVMSEKLIEAIKRANKDIAIVLLDSDIEDLDIPSVLYDNYQGARLVLENLIKNGHKKIAVIKGPDYAKTSELRLKAYYDIMKENGIKIKEEYIIEGSFSKRSGERAIDKIDKLEEKPSAIFAFNDNMAIGALKRLRELNYNVPEDISIAGFDDIDMARYCFPQLTTVRQDQYEIGEIAAKLLYKLINNEKIEQTKIYLKQELIERDSVKKYFENE